MKEKKKGRKEKEEKREELEARALVVQQRASAVQGKKRPRQTEFQMRMATTRRQSGGVFELARLYTAIEMTQHARLRAESASDRTM